MRIGVGLIAVVPALLCALHTQPAVARTWRILPDGSGDAPTIQAGIDSAIAGDSIELACGTYYEHDILMKAGITLYSETGLPDCAVIDAQQLGRAFVCMDLNPNSDFSGLMITGGRAADEVDYGGGMLCVNSQVTLSHCEFIANYASYRGGAISAAQCELIVSDCRFVGNEGEMGGGGGIFFDEVAGELVRCQFEANAGIDGAGLYCRRSSPNITWCTFMGNEGLFFGGAIYCELNASPEISHCTLVGNQAHLGAGIMTTADSYPYMSDSIIAFGIDGAGIHCFGSTSYLFLSCSDVYGNEGGGYSGSIDDQTGTNGNIAAEPLFCDIAMGDLHLAADSPCLPENNDCGMLMGAWGGGCATTPIVDNLLATLYLAQNYPNPFNPQTTIAWDLDRPQRTAIAVYDLSGRLLTVLVDRTLPAGNHSIVWDGTDARGQAVPSGVYVVRLAVEHGTRARKVMLIR